MSHDKSAEFTCITCYALSRLHQVDWAYFSVDIYRFRQKLKSLFPL